jgi:hypothetical protein
MNYAYFLGFTYKKHITAKREVSRGKCVLKYFDFKLRNRFSKKNLIRNLSICKTRFACTIYIKEHIIRVYLVHQIHSKKPPNDMQLKILIDFFGNERFLLH